MNTEIEAAVWRLTDAELLRLWCGLTEGFLVLPPEPTDDLVRLYAYWCLLEKRPAVFLRVSPSTGLTRLIVADHAPQLLPALIQTAIEAGVAIRRILPTAGIFTGSVTADRALAVARLFE